jgi:hypothetical protein
MPGPSCFSHHAVEGSELPQRNPRRSYKRDVLWKRVKAMGMPCHICGLPIDYSLPARHPLSYELDEVVPVSKGGDPASLANCLPAHRCCNQWRSDRSMAAVESVRAEVRRRFGPWPSALAFCEAARAVSRGLKGKSAQVPVRHPKRRSGAL